MSVVIDQVAGRVESEAGPPAAAGQGAVPAAPQEPPAGYLERQQRRLESRRLRLAAD